MEYSEETLRVVQSLTLFDDDLMSLAFEDKRVTETLLRLVIKKDLKIKRLKSQYAVKGLKNRGIRFDIFAVDRDGAMYDIEVQRRDEGAVSRRARYNSGMLDANVTSPGEKLENLMETYIIFLTENDVLGGGKQLYHIERTILETGELFGDGAHIIYVNGSKIDETALGQFLHDMHCQDAGEMYNELLAERMRYFKEDLKGVATVCKKVEEYGDRRAAEAMKHGRAEGRAEGQETQAKESALKLYKRKMPLDEIAEIVSYPVSTIKKWLGLVTA